MSRRPTTVKRYASGGLVTKPAKESDGWKDRLDRARPGKDIDRAMPVDPGEASRDENEFRALRGGPSRIGLAKGGKVKRVAGKPIGKEDGLIAAQKGEFVIRKAAVKKYGDRKMAAVNAGTARVSTPKKRK